MPRLTPYPSTKRTALFHSNAASTPCPLAVAWPVYECAKTSLHDLAFDGGPTDRADGFHVRLVFPYAKISRSTRNPASHIQESIRFHRSRGLFVPWNEMSVIRKDRHLWKVATI